MKYTLTDPNGNVLLAVESSPVVTEADMRADLDKAAKACESAFDEVTKYQDAMTVMSSEGFGEQAKAVASKVLEKIKEAIKRLIEWIKRLIKYIKDEVKNVFDKIKKFFASLFGKKSIVSVQDVRIETKNVETEHARDQTSDSLPSVIPHEEIDKNEVITIYYTDNLNNKTHVSVNLLRLVNVMKTSEAFRNKTSFEFINPGNDFSNIVQTYQSVDAELRKLFGEFKFGNSPDSVIASINSIDEEAVADHQSIAANTISNIEKELFVKTLNEIDFARSIKTLLDNSVINSDFGKVLKANDSFLSEITQHLMEYEAELELVQQSIDKNEENAKTIKASALKSFRDQISLSSNAISLFTIYSSNYAKIVSCITSALDNNADKTAHISNFTNSSKDFPPGVVPVYYQDGRLSSGLHFNRTINVGINHRELVKELISSIDTIDASKNDILSEEYHRNCLRYIKTLCSLDSTILSVIGDRPEKSNSCIIYSPGINIPYGDGSKVMYTMEIIFDNRTIVDGVTTVYSTSPISGLTVLKGSIGQGFTATANGGNFAMGINKNKVVPRIYFAKKPMIRSGRYLDDGILKDYLEQTLINSFESGYQVFDMSTKRFVINYLLALNIYECDVSDRVVYNDPEHPGALYIDDVDGKGLPCHNITTQWYKDNNILSSIPIDKRDAFKEYVKNNVRNLPKGCPILPVYYAI